MSDGRPELVLHFGTPFRLVSAAGHEARQPGAARAALSYCFRNVTVCARTSPPALMVVCSDPSGRRAYRTNLG